MDAWLQSFLVLMEDGRKKLTGKLGKIVIQFNSVCMYMYVCTYVCMYACMFRRVQRGEMRGGFLTYFIVTPFSRILAPNLNFLTPRLFLSIITKFMTT